jgi:hypothetical protein
MSTDRRVAAEALEALHGARELPPKEAVNVLGKSINLVNSSCADSASDAAAEALKHLNKKLEA